MIKNTFLNVYTCHMQLTLCQMYIVCYRIKLMFNVQFLFLERNDLKKIVKAQW